MTETPDERLTRHQAAERLGVSLSRLAQHRRAGRIRHHKNPITGRVFYLASEVARFRIQLDALDDAVSDAASDSDTVATNVVPVNFQAPGRAR